MKTLHPALSEADWIQLNDLLKEALELEGLEREKWIAGLSPDAAPLQGLLRQLLADSSLDSTNSRLGASVARVAADALDGMRRERTGDRVGPWQLDRLLAEGGMGDVWVATRADGLVQRTVALKLPRAEWVDRGLTMRIARERAILARLQHPHIAVLYDAGLGVEGRPYLALEYVEGVPLDAWCKGRDLRAVLRLFVQLGRAVAYAHAQLVIHRDLKPSNVLVTADGTPKLLDFGISKMIEGDAQTADETELTRLVGRRLTLAYAAPEQVLGEPIGVASDVYALGVMLFELVTGQRLYLAKEARALESEVLRGELRRPSDAAADRSQAKALRGDLDAIVLTALQREPAMRYAGAAALADDLERFLAGKPITARPDSLLYRLRKFVVRNALYVTAATAVVVAIGIGLGAALLQAERATALTAFVLSLIRQADPNASQQTRAADLSMLASIESKIDHEFNGAPDQRLNLQFTVAEAYRNRGEMMAARRVFQRAVDEAAPHIPADELLLLTARVRASDYDLIVSTAASRQLDEAIEVLGRKSLRGTAEDELLIDALLTRHVLQAWYGLPAHLPSERRFDAFKQAEALAMKRFGEGSRQHLRVLAASERLIRNIEGGPAARQRFDAAIRRAEQRGSGATDSAEFLAAGAKRVALRCEDGIEQADPAEALRGVIDRVRATHGATSVLLEELHLALGRCERAADAPIAVPAEAAAYDIAAARERPPSTHVMRRALDAFDAAMLARRLADASRFHQSAMENAEAIPERELRDRLTAVARIGHVCLLTELGDAQAAERAAAPLIADSNAVYAKIGRLTPRQGELWTCLAQAQRQQADFDRALLTLNSFMERCSTTPLSAKVMLLCSGEALIERALVEVDSGRIAAAQATIAERLAMSRDMKRHRTYALAYGRVLLSSGHAAQAVEPLRVHHETWFALQPDSPFTAEALYWLGRAYMAAGEPRGRPMVIQANDVLARSPVMSHRRLAADSGHR